MSEFIIYDYTGCKNPDDGTVQVVSLKELFDALDAAKKDDTIKIAVYEIGDCVLNWSHE